MAKPEIEKWAWIKGYEDRYQISSKGRLKSYLGDENGKVISLTHKDGWYFTIRLSDKYGRNKTKRIHRLVAEAFIGSIPSGYHVHHKDGNKQNNCVENLEIIHPSKHRLESIKMNPDSIKGMNNYNRYVKNRPVRQYTLDGYYIAEYVNATIASELTGVCQRNILQVASHTPYGKNNNIRHQAGGYIWKFGEGGELDADA